MLYVFVSLFGPDLSKRSITFLSFWTYFALHCNLFSHNLWTKNDCTRSGSFQCNLQPTVVFYGRPFVSKLWHDIRAVFCHVYLRSFLLCGFFFQSMWPFSSQTRIYMRTTRAHTYALQTSMCIWGHRKSSYKHWRTGKILLGGLNMISPNETYWSQVHKMILSWRQVFFAMPWQHGRSK